MIAIHKLIVELCVSKQSQKTTHVITLTLAILLNYVTDEHTLSYS